MQRKDLGGIFLGQSPASRFLQERSLQRGPARSLEVRTEHCPLRGPLLEKARKGFFAAKPPVQGPSAAGNAVRVGMGTWGWCQMLASIMHRAMVTGGVSITVPQPQAPLAQPVLPNTHTHPTATCLHSTKHKTTSDPPQNKGQAPSPASSGLSTPPPSLLLEDH